MDYNNKMKNEIILKRCMYIRYGAWYRDKSGRICGKSKKYLMIDRARKFSKSISQKRWRKIRIEILKIKSERALFWNMVPVISKSEQFKSPYHKVIDILDYSWQLNQSK